MRKPFKAKAFFKPSPFFESTSMSVERNMMELIKAKSEEIGLPINQLISIAIDNELSQTTPFNYDVGEPSVPYMELAYLNEAAKMLKFIKEYSKVGIGRDQLMLMRRAYGIDSQHVVRLALRELLKQGMAEEHRPSPQVIRFQYNRDYMYIRAVGVPEEELKKTKHKELPRG